MNVSSYCVVHKFFIPFLPTLLVQTLIKACKRTPLTLIHRVTTYALTFLSSSLCSSSLVSWLHAALLRCDIPFRLPHVYLCSACWRTSHNQRSRDKQEYKVLWFFLIIDVMLTNNLCNSQIWYSVSLF